VPAAPLPAAPLPAAPPPAVPELVRASPAAQAPALAPYPGGDNAADAAQPEQELWTAPPGVPRLEAWIGVGNTWVPSASFDAFADDDALTGVSAGAALRLGSTEGAGVRLLASWDMAGRSSTYRGEDTALDVMRFGLGPELELPIVQRLDVHLRGAATALSLKAELDESSTGATMSDSAWAFGVEGALGVTFRFADLHKQRSPLSFLLRAEAGYAWVAKQELLLEPDGGPRRSEGLSLGDLELAGPVVRVGVGAGF
jgi:hypothetical protein